MNGNILTKQEEKVLSSLSKGSLYKEIADQHNISVNTVKKHLKNIYRKMNVKSRYFATKEYLASSDENTLEQNTLA